MLAELKTVVKKPMLWITMIGVALVPALYNIIFLSSMWDPYGKVSDLPVAVVNEDKAATYNGKKMTIGQDMTDNMSRNKNLDYHFVSQKKAEKGLKNGDYYMVITLPQDLSENAASVLTDNPKKLTIPYQTSKGHSFVASKMSESAIKTLRASVSKNVTNSYTKSLFKSLVTLKNGLGKAADASKKLTAGSEKLEKGSQTMSSNLNALSSASQTFAQGTDSLYSGLESYTGGVSQLANGTNQLNSKSQDLLNGISQFSSGSSQIQQLVNAASQLNQGLVTLSSKTGLSSEQTAQISQLVDSLTQLNSAIQNYSIGSSTATSGSGDLSSYLSNIATAAQTIVNSANNSQQTQTTTSNQQSSLAAVQATSAYQKMSAEDQAEISAALSNANAETSTTTTSGVDAATVSQAQSILTNVSNIQKALPNAQAAASAAANASASINQLKQTANLILPSASTTLSTLSSGLTQTSAALNSQIIPVSSQLANGASLLGSRLSNGVSALTEGVTAYTNAVGTLNAGANQLNANSAQLMNGTAQLANGANQISTGAGQLAEGGQQLTTGLTSLSSGNRQLAKAMSGAKNQLSLVAVTNSNADTLASPVSVKHTDKDHVKTNGVGMAPYMMSAALMVMALSTNTIFREALSGKKAKSLREWIDQKLAVNGLIAVAGAIILYFGVHLIGLSANFEAKTLGLTILVSLTFMTMVTALVTWHDKFGAFASLILLLLQLGSSAGTYPLDLTDEFFRIVNPYLPMSYSVSGLRETISMAGTINHQIIILSIFLLLFIVLALIVARRKVALNRLQES